MSIQQPHNCGCSHKETLTLDESLRNTTCDGPADEASAGRSAVEAAHENRDSTGDLTRTNTHGSSQTEADAEKATQITQAKDWTDARDPGNAHNWPLWQRIIHTYLVAGIALTTSFATSAYTAAIDAVAQDFNVSQETALVPYIIFVLGLAFGAPFASPLSEAVGRKYVYLICMPIFALFIAGVGLSQSIAALCVTRFFAGVSGSPALSIGSATISDIWPPSQRSAPMSIYVATTLLGPCLGPLIGGYVTTEESWRWTSWVVLLFLATFFLPAIFMKETYKRAILVKRAKMLGIPGPQSVGGDRSWKDAVKNFLQTGLARPLHMLFTEPVVAACTFYVAFNFALLYAFFAAFPYVFETYYGFSLEQVGLTFIGLGVGCLVGLAVTMAVDHFVYQPRVRAARDKKLIAAATSKVPPEQRLLLSQIGGPCITAGLFLFGWSAWHSLHWIAPVIGEALFGCGNFLVFMSSVLYAMDTYGPLYGASTQAANTLTRYILGAAFPLFAVQMFRGLGVQWACTLLGLLSLAACAMPWVFARYGQQMRARSGYRHGS